MMVDNNNNDNEYVDNGSEGYFRWIIDSVTDGVWEWDLLTDQTYFSPSWKKNLGYENDEIDHKVDAWKALIHPEDMEYVLNSHWLYLNKQIPKFEVKYRLRTKEGSYKWILGRGKAIWDSNGKAIKMIGTHTDVTAHIMASELLKESEERYRRLVELSPDAVFVHVNEQCIFANNAGLQLLGIEKQEDMKGTFIWKYIHSDSHESARNRINSVLRDSGPIPLIEEKLIKTDGTALDVEVATSYIRYNGETAILSIIRDVSERKRSEQEMKRILEHNKELLQETLKYDRLKTEFFSNISHELRTPLNLILGIVQLLGLNSGTGDSIEKDKYHRYLRVMKQNCYRLVRLINNLIDITKIDAGFMNMRFQNIDIISVIEDITLSVAEYTKSKGITLIFDTEMEENIISCDIEKIERVMLNLLSNAIKFSKENGCIWVNIYDLNDHIKIVVKDSGIGIPQEKLATIFERFTLVDSSLNRKSEGSGIGLSLVKAIIEAHGGKISVNSKVDKGSEFIIELPVRRIDEENEVFSDIINVKEINIERLNIEFSDIYS